jgi:hypothetical protein
MAPNRWVDFIAGTASCALIATGLAWTGHPAALDPRWLGIGLNATHVLAVGTWFGGLGALALAVRRPGEPETAAGLLERFSRVATVTFPVAVATGLALAWQVIPGWDDLVETGYGRLLIAKVAFVAMAGAAAFVHRRRTVDAVRRTGGSRPAIRLLAVEIAFLAVAIGLTATLTGRPPEASISSAEDTSAPFSTDRFVEPYHAILGLAPGKAGSNTLTVDLHDLDPLNSTPPAAVEARVSFGEGRAGPASYSLGHVLGPRWEAEISLLQAGDWSLTLVITLPDGEQEELELVVPIGR